MSSTLEISIDSHKELERRLTRTTSNHFTALLLSLLDDTRDLVESGLANDRTSKVFPRGARASFDFLGLSDQSVLKAVLPERSRNVAPRKGRALLTRVLESSSDSLNDTRLDVGRRVIEMEVFTTSFTYNSGVAPVDVEVLGNVLPELSEDVGRTSEVETSKLLVINTLLDNLRGVSRDELNDGGRKAGLEEDLVDNVVGVGGHRRGLPDTDVADNDGGANEVTTDSSEVEGSYGKDETLERSVLNPARFTISFNAF